MDAIAYIERQEQMRYRGSGFGSHPTEPCLTQALVDVTFDDNELHVFANTIPSWYGHDANYVVIGEKRGRLVALPLLRLGFSMVGFRSRRDGHRREKLVGEAFGFLVHVSASACMQIVRQA